MNFLGKNVTFDCACFSDDARPAAIIIIGIFSHTFAVDPRYSVC